MQCLARVLLALGAATAWARRLLRPPQVNPEEYERVRCDLCNGTGIWIGLREHSLSEPKPVGFYEGDHCPKCCGEGWLRSSAPDREGEGPSLGTRRAHVG
jgi:hypothetical protein